MTDSAIVLNETEARRARSTLARIDDAVSTISIFCIAKSNLPPDVIEQHRKAVRTARTVLSSALELYERARAGDFDDLLSRWRADSGTVLIIARIARGMAQADLAEKLGLREQQIQRYEAERYRSISLQNYRRIAAALGVELEAKIKDHTQPWVKFHEPALTSGDIKKVVAHAKENNWFDPPKTEMEQKAFLLEYIRESTTDLGSPALLRTGLNAQDLTHDLLLA